jgi:chromosome segregation ATPase
VVLCEEREAMLMLEVAELERQKEEITQEKEDKEREAMIALRPRLEALNLHIQQLTSEIEDASGQSSKLNAERAELEERASGLNSEIQVLAVDVAEQRDVMMKGKGEPGKMKKQVCTPPSVQGRWACCRDCTLFSVWRV